MHTYGHGCRWRPADARAARLPITSPFACLDIALFDADFSALDLVSRLGKDKTVRLRR
jgi:hypothetical protein